MQGLTVARYGNYAILQQLPFIVYIPGPIVFRVLIKFLLVRLMPLDRDKPYGAGWQEAALDQGPYLLSKLGSSIYSLSG